MPRYRSSLSSSGIQILNPYWVISCTNKHWPGPWKVASRFIIPPLWPKCGAATPDDYHETNVTGTRNVLETAAKTCGVQKLVYTSTCGVWGPTIKHPMTETDPRITGFPIAYERTKYLAELEVQKFVKQGLPVVIVNPSRVYGEGPITDSNTVGKMVSGYLKGTWRFIPGNGEQVANYAFLDDVVAGHIAAMDRGVIGERYILGGHDISFNDFFKTLQAHIGQAIGYDQDTHKTHSVLQPAGVAQNQTHRYTSCVFT
jgi:nucleoside-diphosphate-sugar epimerase